MGGGGGRGSAFRAIGFGYGCNGKGDTRVKCEVWSGREGGDENGGVKRSESWVDGIQWQMEGKEKSKGNADK